MQANRFLQYFLSLAVLILPLFEADDCYKYICYIFDGDSKFYEDLIEVISNFLRHMNSSLD